MENTSLIATQDLSFLGKIRYPDLLIAEGKTTFICGESGSGKSSLLKLFNASLSPSGGEVYYRGQALETLETLALRREVLLISQSVFLFDGSIRENFAQYLDYRGLTAPNDSEILKLLRICAAEEFPLDALCQNLSGGEKQRVFLAIGLACHAKVLLLDEPSSALDEQTAQRLFRNLTAYSREQGMTLVVVSHDLNLAQTFADEIITLEAGAKR